MAPQRLRVGALVAATTGGAWLAWKVLCWAGSSPPADTAAPQEPLSARQERLQAAEQRFRDLFPQVPVVSCQEARSLLQAQPGKYVLVDVRNKEEQQVSMVQGSITKAEFEEQRASYKDATAVCYCTVGYRSSQYAASLLDQGLTALNLQGGIIGWTHAGLPLVDGSDGRRPSTRVHTYSDRWAMQGDGYQPVQYAHSHFVLVRDVLRAIKAKLGL